MEPIGSGNRISSPSEYESVLEGEEEQDELSSSDNDVMENDLSAFRRQWHAEIANDGGNCSNSRFPSGRTSDNTEAKAKEFFMKGADLEKEGLLTEAIQFYRKSVQLVPDIEFRLYESIRKERPDDQKLSAGGNDSIARDDFEEDSECNRTGDGADEVQKYLLTAPALCTPAVEQRTTHISSLPTEILLLIFRYVVTNELDIRSLDICSLVCRGFYRCARDPEIWRLICGRIWGGNCVWLNTACTWRDTYMKSPHLQFSGCYISKTTYIRHGENSFQDQFYRPWHLVEYYRYLRFFPDGVVLMMTSAEGPGPMVGHLRFRNPKHAGVIVGSYRQSHNLILMIFKRNDRDMKSSKSRNRNDRPNADHVQQTYDMGFMIKSWKMKSELAWVHYEVSSNYGGTETISNFEIPNSKFPSFWFSRVKSYTSESDNLLT